MSIGCFVLWFILIVYHILSLLNATGNTPDMICKNAAATNIAWDIALFEWVSEGNAAGTVLNCIVLYDETLT